MGDWVGLLPGADGRIVHRFERRTCLVRKQAGRRIEAQVLAANVDAVLIVSSLNADFNPRRLERYLAIVLESGARPVFVLNKADLCDAPERFLEAVHAIAPTAPVALVSALEGGGLDALRAHVREGETAALVDGFHKLEAEGRHLRERQDARARAESKRLIKERARAMRRNPKA